MAVDNEWVEYRRRLDGERVGWLASADGGFVPMSLLGWPLADVSSRDDAEQRLEDEGIGYLADVWLLDDGEGEQRVRFTEVTPDRVTLITDNFGAIDVPFVEHTLPVPVPPVLRWL